MSKIHLITYGNDTFKNSKMRLYNQAINLSHPSSSPWFDTISLYGPEALSQEFRNKFSHILNQSRIGGYGIWRPYIIKQKLNEINENDILIYLDAGCSINQHGKKRFDEYIEMLNNNDKSIISFQMGHKEKVWRQNKEIL